MARAEQGESLIRIGFLPLGSPSKVYDQSLVEAFRPGLRQVGLEEYRFRWQGSDRIAGVRGDEIETLAPFLTSLTAGRRSHTALYSLGPAINEPGWVDIVAALRQNYDPILLLLPKFPLK